MFSILHLIDKYGYLIVFLGAMVEGESIILTASMLSASGILSLYKVCALAFLGTCIAEQLMYNVGYYIGSKLIDKWHLSRKAFNKIKPVILNHETAYILTCRFIYGIRTISPLLIGIVRVNPKKYFMLNIIASAIWSVISCALGYSLGYFTKGIGLNFKYIIMINFIVIIVIILIAKIISKIILKSNNINLE